MSSNTKNHRQQMTAISNKLYKLSERLKTLAYHLNEENPFSLSQAAVDVHVCREAANMIEMACKHLTTTGTKC